MDDKITDILTQLLPSADDEVLSLLQENGQVKTYEKGSFLTRQGELETVFYVLIEGQVEVRKYSHGEYHYVDYLKAGDCFGELALIFELPRAADVTVAQDTTRVLEIDRADFDKHLKWNPQALHALMQLVVQRTLKQLDQRLYELSRKLADDEPDIIISYSRDDEAFARQLVQSLKKQGLHIWIDIFDIETGKSWARQIGEALDICKVMVLIMSPSSMESENVEDEWNYYLDKSRPILPLLYKECDVPYRLHKLQYIDFTALGFDDAMMHMTADLRIILNKVL